MIQKGNGTFGVCICCLLLVKEFDDSCALVSDDPKGFVFSKYCVPFWKKDEKLNPEIRES